MAGVGLGVATVLSPLMGQPARACQAKVFNYHTCTVPYVLKFYAMKIKKLLSIKNLLLYA